MISAMKKDIRAKMEKTVSLFLNDISGIKTGRAKASLLDGITVDYYGGRAKLNTIANITASDKLLTITAWDASIIGNIKSAIESSNLGFGISCEFSTIRLTVPDLTEDMRKNLVKLLSKLSEEAKVSIRNIRRDSMDKLKLIQENKEISKDDFHVCGLEIQKMTDEFIKKISDAFVVKESEILSI
ncbi:ribosome recycling factor [Neoehrlichia mikurensis]|uniref:Ribosome-recycling factor n=1 Tax=Neoehrlichia mikurensis TaxID=89586 RepID=A0A9Q9F429_9RICK|nr:ribosome recycling factor [Neoehrlichia mikurensis]QXK91694.1 ribosome recycling factor [Neoehrlichia mikurensis]QXK92905.1 ribosome recycling factor [Neoehrlichia mikurensis]QXK93385.1 ribosome recycling factor [Neoehrlichia mikurensis]UTO55667.1 ribosome recycling factor [Neoehrlichia mikurensis]UTO56587.1 ribosome recycling factor [Neoehrlichia mikurensis]